MDFIDDANEKEQCILDKRIAAIRQRSEVRKPFTGKCYFCYEPLEQRLFCDNDCSLDFERLENQKLQRG